MPWAGSYAFPDLTPQSRFEAVSAQSTAWRQIIGVVGDARNDGVDRPVVPAIYLPYTTVMPPYAQFFVRTQGDPLTYLHSIRAAVASVASDQQTPRSFNGTFTLNEAIERDAQYSRQRLFSILFGVFSAMALALALVGIFSVVAYSVAQRTTEFGVRLALGAPRAHVLWVAARIALVSTGSGVTVGLALDSFLGAILAALDAKRLRCRRSVPPPRSSPSARFSPACYPHPAPPPSHPPKLCATNKKRSHPR